MDQLRTHLSDLLDNITHLHAQNQSQYTQHLQKQLQHQLKQQNPTSASPTGVGADLHTNNVASLPAVVVGGGGYYSLQATSVSSMNLNNGTSHANISSCSSPSDTHSAPTASQTTSPPHHHSNHHQNHHNHQQQQQQSQPSTVLLTVTSSAGVNSGSQPAGTAIANFDQQQIQVNQLISKLQDLISTLIKVN
jgi:hypothetical protein